MLSPIEDDMKESSPLQREHGTVHGKIEAAHKVFSEEHIYSSLQLVVLSKDADSFLFILGDLGLFNKPSSA